MFVIIPKPPTKASLSNLKKLNLNESSKPTNELEYLLVTNSHRCCVMQTNLSNRDIPSDHQIHLMTQDATSITQMILKTGILAIGEVIKSHRTH